MAAIHAHMIAPAGSERTQTEHEATHAGVASRAHSRGSPNRPRTEDNDVLKVWATQYYMPEERDAGDSGKDIAGKYRPPTSDWPGIMVACTVITLWATVFLHALFVVKLPAFVTPQPEGVVQQHSSWLHIIATFFALEFLYTGLFITTHDAMHGAIAMRNRKLNDAMGQLAIALYAWFDFDMLHKHHWEHHNNTGVVNKDPDFHSGNPGVIPWFIRFMATYSSLWQFTRVAYWAVFWQVLGAPFENLLVYMAGSAILSAFRLFYFGTYMPHHPEPNSADAATKTMCWQMSRSSHMPRIVSFFTCYHFDMHWEHHRFPFAPWWELPVCRAIKYTSRGQPLPTVKNKLT